MSNRPPASDSFGLAEFCRWLESLRGDPSNLELLRVVLGQPRGADLEFVLGSVRRMVDVMTVHECNDPGRLDEDRRQEIASDAEVDVSDVAELFLRFDAAASLVKDNDQVRRMLLGQHLGRAAKFTKPLSDPIDHHLQRDLRLWEFLLDADPITIS